MMNHFYDFKKTSLRFLGLFLVTVFCGGNMYNQCQCGSPVDDGELPDGSILDGAGTEEDEENLPPSPFALFYGNKGTWGSLGVDDEGNLYTTVAQVVDKFGLLCEQTRQDTSLGKQLKCHADLIGYSPNGYINATQQVAEEIITTYQASISIDVRTKGSLTFEEVGKIIEEIFSGTSGIVSLEFLKQHPIGLSIDLEPQIVTGHYSEITATVANGLCSTYKSLMTELGHDPSLLICFLYEFGYPMMADGENLEPSIFPVLMSFASVEYCNDTETDQECLDKTLSVKEQWVDWLNEEYSNTDRTGCMFFTAAYLTKYQRDYFTFTDALGSFGDKCYLYAFQ